MDELSITIGNNIKKIREQKGFNKMQMAKALGIGCDQIYKWEGGVFAPSAYSLVLIAKTFSCSIDELCGLK